MAVWVWRSYSSSKSYGVTTMNLVDLAAAVADGTPVDWHALASTTGDFEERLLIEDMRLIERIAEAHAAHITLTSTLGPAIRTEEPPATWGPLVINEKIASGTYGDVYRAFDPRLERTVALKLRRRVEAAAVESALVEEGRLMARVRHPHVVTIDAPSGSRGASGCGWNWWRAARSKRNCARRARFRQPRSRWWLVSCRAHSTRSIMPDCCTATSRRRTSCRTPTVTCVSRISARAASSSRPSGRPDRWSLPERLFTSPRICCRRTGVPSQRCLQPRRVALSPGHRICFRFRAVRFESCVTPTHAVVARP